MNKNNLEQLLQSIKAGDLSVEDALNSLSHLQFHDTGTAKVDCHRQNRCGIPEVVFCSGKTPKQVADIFECLVNANGKAFGTRASAEQFTAVKEKFSDARYNEPARTITVADAPVPKTGLVTIISAGTSDTPVAEEARETAEFLGSKTEAIYDIGVAGVHRFFAYMDTINKAHAIVAVAGMEGALPSLVGGLVSVPVIACPTSVGYGASFGGIAALLGMLNSCTPGVSVVNIDDGFGAACVAHLINTGTNKGDTK